MGPPRRLRPVEGAPTLLRLPESLRQHRQPRAPLPRRLRGALLVQARLCLTDEETVEQIRENPYIQYFLGFEGYRSEKKPYLDSYIRCLA